MIAMQYSFVLPADYDMDVIRRRIAERGHFTDDFPQLDFKAYLYADRTTGQSQDNLYAPFYLWEDAEGMNNFLGGPGFAALKSSFGRPSINVWSVWHAQSPIEPNAAHHATREVLPIPPDASLGSWRDAEVVRLAQDIAVRGALGGVVAFEPTTWTLVRFRLWAHEPATLDVECAQRYDVGHVSQPRRGTESRPHLSDKTAHAAATA
jgi:hypothetical protein